MDTSKLLFYISLAVVCGVITFFVKNRQRYFLFLLVFFAPLNIGIIIRHLNGIFVMDVPLLFLVLYGIFSGRRFRIYLGIPAFGIIILSLISSLDARYIDLGIWETTRFIRAYLAFLCVVNFTKNKRDLYAVISALVLGLTFYGLLGFYQWRHGSMGLTFLGESFFRWRARGLFSHPAMFADYLILVIPIVLRLFVFYKPGKKQLTYVFGFVLIISCASLLGTYARGPWIGFAGSVLLMGLFTLFQKRFYPKVVSATAMMVLVTAIAAVHYVPTIVSQFTSEYRTKSTDVRMPLVLIGIRVVENNLLLGVGPGNYEFTSYKYVTPMDAKKLGLPFEQLCQVVHNSYLLIAAESGVFSLLLFLFILVVIYKTGWKVVRIKHPLISNLGFGILTGFTALLIAFLAGPDYTQHQVMMIFWVLAGLLVALSKFRTAPPQGTRFTERSKSEIIQNTRKQVYTQLH